MEKNMNNTNAKEFFEEFNKAKDRVMDAGTKMCEILDGLTLRESIITVTYLLEAVIENSIDVSKDVEASFEITSSVLSELFIYLNKKYDLDFMAVLSRAYLKSKNPEMFKHLEEMINNLRDDEDEESEEGKENIVC